MWFITYTRRQIGQDDIEILSEIINDHPFYWEKYTSKIHEYVVTLLSWKKLNREDVDVYNRLNGIVDYGSFD